MKYDHSTFPLVAAGSGPSTAGQDKGGASIPTPGGPMNPTPKAPSGGTQPKVDLPATEKKT